MGKINYIVEPLLDKVLVKIDKFREETIKDTVLKEEAKQKLENKSLDDIEKGEEFDENDYTVVKRKIRFSIQVAEIVALPKTIHLDLKSGDLIAIKMHSIENFDLIKGTAIIRVNDILGKVIIDKK